MSADFFHIKTVSYKSPPVKVLCVFTSAVSGSLAEPRAVALAECRDPEDCSVCVSCHAHIVARMPASVKGGCGQKSGAMMTPLSRHAQRR